MLLKLGFIVEGIIAAVLATVCLYIASFIFVAFVKAVSIGDVGQIWAGTFVMIFTFLAFLKVIDMGALAIEYARK
jgi:hypothetical protein